MSTPVHRVISALEKSGCKPKETENGWSALCPAHDDHDPSLSISEGNDGRALVHCFASCPTEDIVSELKLKIADLMPAQPSTEPPGNGEKPEKRRRRRSRTFETIEDATNALDTEMKKKEGAQRVKEWKYREMNGEVFAIVLRYEGRNVKGVPSKTYRPVTRHDDGWVFKAMPEPRLLYRLPELKNETCVFITEGEKAAEIANSLGLTATTSSNGARSAKKTDWSPLANKVCVILPDNDSPGKKYAREVADILLKLDPPATVKIVELPDLPEHGDIADYVEANSQVDPVVLRQQVEELAATAEPIQLDRPTATEFKSFPTDALPQPIRKFVELGAKAIGCDSSYLALPLLSALASAIGDTRALQLKLGWCAPPIIWTVIVGESGSSKTPAFKLVTKPLDDRQQEAFESLREEKMEYDEELERYEKAKSVWKRGRQTQEPPPHKPEEPSAARYIVQDTTVEALAPILGGNPRGLLLKRDELAGWFGSFDRYSGGKSSTDEASWLSMHNGEAIVIDRKGGKPPTIHVPRAIVSITGGIQPTVLHRALGTVHRESGLAARFLMAYPPRKPKRWSEDNIDPIAEAELKRLYDSLFQLEPTIDDQGCRQPKILTLENRAKDLWIQYYDQHAKEQIDLSGELSAAWSKLEEYAARLALVIHCVRSAAGDQMQINSEMVDESSMRAGIALAEWFKDEARRVYSLLSESEDDRIRRELAEWIGRRGGSITAREVQQGRREIRTADDANSALKSLVDAGYGEWQQTSPGPNGGRGTRRFCLSSASTSTLPPPTQHFGSSVDNGVSNVESDEESIEI